MGPRLGSKSAIQPALPVDLRVRSEERLLLETVAHEPLANDRSDVTVVRSPGAAVQARSMGPVPLSSHSQSIELQPLIERVYASGGHDDIDYGRPQS